MRPIDADALIDALYDNEFQTYCPLDEVAGVIDAAPTIYAATVVRCKDCVLRGEYECPMMSYETSTVSDDWLKWTEYATHDRTVDDGFCYMGRTNDETD